ncbi:MAG: PAS domain S-box protein [Defluviitaleaceae bacterium]|nr:PAS domain S-box protein [Defluviitaleaceae bacterium]
MQGQAQVGTGKNDPHAMFGCDGEVLDCCDDCLIFFGYDDPRQFAKDFYDAQPKHQPNGSKTKATLMHGIQNACVGSPVGGEVVLANREGRIIQTYLEFFRISEDLIICFFQEKFAREAGSASTLGLLEQAPGTVFLIDVDGKITYCNQHALTAFGAKNQDVFANQFFSHYSKKFQQNITAANFMNLQLEKAMKEGMSRFIWHIRRDYNEIAASIRLVRTEFRGLPCCVAYLVEFEAENENYFEGAISHNFLDDATWPIVEAMPFAWKFVDADLNCLECNQAMVQLLGAKNKDTFLAGYHQIYPHKQPDGQVSRDKMLEYLDIAMEKGVTRFEWEMFKFDGTIMTVHITLSPVAIKGRFVFSVFIHDLTTQKALEEQKELDKDRLEAICENAPVGIQIWNRFDEVLFVNEHMARIFGFSNIDEYKKEFESIFPEFQPDGRNTASVAFDIAMNVMKTGIPTAFEWTLLSRSGEAIPLQRKFVRINYGGEHCLMEFCQDLRPQIERENTILRETQNLRSLFGAVPLVFELWDEEQELISVNNFALEFFDMPTLQMYRDNMWNLVPHTQPCGGESKPLFYQHLKDAFDIGKKEVDWVNQDMKGGLMPTRLAMAKVEFEGKPAVICIYQDIRDQVAREEVITKESEKFKLFFNAVDTVCMLWNDRVELVMCNPASATLFGLDCPEEFMKVFHQLSPPNQPCGKNSKEKLIEFVNHAIEFGFVSFEWLHHTIDGADLPCKVVLTRAEFEGRPGVIGIVHDLRESIASEERHKLEIARLNTILNHVPVSIQIWSRDDRLIFINGKMPEILGFQYPYEYMSNHGVFFPDTQECGRDSDEYSLEILRRVFEDGYFRTNWTYQTKDGQLVPMECILIRIDYGGTEAVLEFCRDLREQRAEDEIRRVTEEKLRLLIDNTPMSIGILDANLDLLDTNLVSPEFYGYKSKQEYLDNFKNTWPEFQPDGTKTMEYFFGLAKDAFANKKLTFEATMLRKDGVFLPTELTVIPSELENQPVLLVFAKDMRAHYKHLEEVRRSQETVRAMVNLAPIACVVTDENHNVIECNQMALDLYEESSMAELAFDYKDFCPLDTCDEATCNCKKILGTNIAENLEWQEKNLSISCVLNVKGKSVPVDISGKGVVIEGRNCFVLYIRDLRETFAIDEERRKNRQQINAMLNSSPLASFILDGSGNVLLANGSVVALFGLSSRETFTSNFYKLFPDTQPDGIKSTERWAAKIEQALDAAGDVSFEWLWKSLAGESVSCQITLRRVELDGDDAVIVHMQDLRQIKKAAEAAEALQKMVHTDALTGAFSRRYFDEVAPEKFAQSVVKNKPFSMIMIDVDNFKNINDTYGHQVGDEVLKIIATRTSYSIRSDGFVARYGGEEFVVLMPNVTSEEAAKIACRIRNAIVSSVFLVNGIKLNITASFGVACKDKLTPAGDNDAVIKYILYRADKAMYAAKEWGRDMVVYYNDGKNVRFDCDNETS